MSRTEFGAALRTIRRDLRLSQEALAGTLGTTQRHISFLETGRSAPTRSMLSRIVTGLGLSAGQRGTLFEASGFRNPYPQRSRDAEALRETLDLLAQQVLRHWPFPGFIMDPDWNFLRCNEPAQKMLAAFGQHTNMHSMFLSPGFRALVENWEQASAGFYYRLQLAAQRSEQIQADLAEAVRQGLFDHVGRTLAGEDEVPIYVPIVLRMPDGRRLQISSMHGHMVSVHDAVAESFAIELMVPLDEDTEAPLLEMFG